MHRESAPACSRSPRSRTPAACARSAACRAPSPVFGRHRRPRQRRDQGRPRERRARRDPPRQRRSGPRPTRLRGLAPRRSPALRRRDRLLRGRVHPGSPTWSSRRRPTRRRRAPSPTPTAACSACAATSRSRGHDPRLALPGERSPRSSATRPDAESPAGGLRRALDRRSPSTTRSPTRKSAARASAGATAIQANLDPSRRAAAGASAGPAQPREVRTPRADRRSRPRPPPTAACSLGTYRDLWAADVTELNPALRFLMPKQKLELAKDAEAWTGERRRGHGRRQRPQRRGHGRDPGAHAARAPRS